MKTTGSAIRTYGGNLFDFAHPEKSIISITDIAHSLSLLCRFAGHCRVFYSVSEHSIRVSHACPKEHALWGLMHDASEAFAVDVPRPLKHLVNMEAYRAHEKRIQRAICAKFGMLPVEPIAVKEADNVLLATEQRDLLKNSANDIFSTPLKTQIRPWSSKKAERVFLNRFAELTK